MEEHRRPSILWVKEYFCCLIIRMGLLLCTLKFVVVLLLTITYSEFVYQKPVIGCSVNKLYVFDDLSFSNDGLGMPISLNMLSVE